MIKVLAFDVDGTLSCANNEINRSLHDHLNELRKQGIHIVLCTGRPYEDLRAFQANNDFYTPAILLNGAVISDLDQGMHKVQYLDQTIAKNVCEVLQGLDLPFLCYTEANNIEYPCSQMRYGDVLLMRLGQERYLIEFINSFVLVGDQFDYEKIFKIKTVFEDLNKIDQARKELEKIDGIHVVSSMNFNLEITSSKTNKGKSLLEYIESLGYSQSDVMIFGDSENDRSMFELFEHSVLVANEKNQFDYPSQYRCKSCRENGVFEFLKQNQSLFE